MKDPKGPTRSYKTVQEIAKKHKVPAENIQKQLEMGTKVDLESVLLFFVRLQDMMFWFLTSEKNMFKN